MICGFFKQKYYENQKKTAVLQFWVRCFDLKPSAMLNTQIENRNKMKSKHFDDFLYLNFAFFFL